MGDPVDIIKDVGLNVVTGGLYSVGKGILDTASTGDPSHLLGQGFDLGLSAVGNSVAVDIGGPIAGMTYNIAGAGAGLAGGGLSGIASEGFGTADLAAEQAAQIAANPGVGSIIGTTGTQGILTNETASLAGQNDAMASALSKTPELSTTPPASFGESSGLAGATKVPPVGTPGANLAEMNNPSSWLSSSAGQEVQGNAHLLETQGAKGFWDSLSPGAQTALVTGGFVGGQTIAGGLQGIFAGASAEQKLELEKLINAQYQQQLQYKNKNNTYAPLVSFKPQGIADTAHPTVV